jgi:hypothetical protein
MGTSDCLKILMRIPVGIYARVIRKISKPYMIIVSAEVRLIPTPPVLVVSKKQKISDPGLL